MMTDEQKIELLIKEAEEIVKKGEALKRLYKNPDFQALFLDYYMGTYAQELVQAKANPGLLGEKDQQILDGQMTGIGYLGQFIQLTLTQARTAKDSLEAHEEELRRERDGDE